MCNEKRVAKRVYVKDNIGVQVLENNNHTTLYICINVVKAFFMKYLRILSVTLAKNLGFSRYYDWVSIVRN